ncbi:hypothetical protein B0O99DRAFT_645544 [Bisporella sp. PMI_857]|nr:hypothetical protein B0O99DRAFT_645544 [Bisporella sp. PMI_857]
MKQNGNRPHSGIDTNASQGSMSVTGSSVSRVGGSVDASLRSAGKDLYTGNTTNITNHTTINLPTFTLRQPRQSLPKFTPRQPRQSLPMFTPRQPRQSLPTFTPRQPRPSRRPQDSTRRSSGEKQSDTTTNEVSSSCPFCERKDVEISKKRSRLESLETENKSLSQKIHYLEEALEGVIMAQPVDNVPWLAVCLPAAVVGLSTLWHLPVRQRILGSVIWGTTI